MLLSDLFPEKPLVVWCRSCDTNLEALMKAVLIKYYTIEERLLWLYKVSDISRHRISVCPACCPVMCRLELNSIHWSFCTTAATLCNFSICETLLKYTAITQLLFCLWRWPWERWRTSRSNSCAKLKSGLSDQAGVFDVQRWDALLW